MKCKRETALFHSETSLPPSHHLLYVKPAWLPLAEIAVLSTVPCGAPVVSHYTTGHIDGVASLTHPKLPFTYKIGTYTTQIPAVWSAHWPADQSKMCKIYMKHTYVRCNPNSEKQNQNIFECSIHDVDCNKCFFSFCLFIFTNTTFIKVISH